MVSVPTKLSGVKENPEGRPYEPTERRRAFDGYKATPP
jgi:hypothetical protein